MGVVVQFDYAKWIARYPEFTSVSQPTAQAYFDEATIYHANNGSGPVSTAAIQLTLLNMVTAHIAKRYAVINGEQPSPLVGVIDSASEGSVSVGVSLDIPPGTAQWYAQTKYGFDYWLATAPYRQFRHRPGRPRVFTPGFRGIF